MVVGRGRWSYDGSMISSDEVIWTGKMKALTRGRIGMPTVSTVCFTPTWGSWTVRKRTSKFNEHATGGSHVMEYGNTSVKAEKLYLYQGFDPATVNFPPNEVNHDTRLEAINQRDAGILFLWHMYKISEDGSKRKEILTQITETMRLRIHLGGPISLLKMGWVGRGKRKISLTLIKETKICMFDIIIIPGMFFPYCQ